MKRLKKVRKKTSKKKRKLKSRKKSREKPKKKIPKKSKTSRPKKTSEEKLRISSGVPGFDSLVEGGFLKNSTNVVVGSSGSGKSIFAIQFLIDGLKKKENCLYITFEEKKNEFYRNMKMFGWELESYEKKGLFTFLEYTPEKVKTMLEEGGGIIESIVLTKGIKRIAIDSISSFTLLFEDELEKRQSSLRLFELLQKWDCTTLLTVEEDPLTSIGTDSKAVEFESDSIINLYYIRSKGKRERYIEILKMRGTNHSNKTYLFEITKKGIQINPQPIKEISFRSK